MASVKENPAFDGILENTASLFVQAGLSFSSTPLITFVCGGADKSTPLSINDLVGYPRWLTRLATTLRGHVPDQVSFRKRYIDWALESEPGLACVRAETAITDLMGATRPRGRVDDLALVEVVIAEVCDRVLLFAESPGSLAELGMFCMREDIAAKTLVVIQEQHQGGSFVMRGPISRMSRYSNYVPAVIGADVPAVFRAVSQRLTADPPHNEALRESLWGELSLRQKYCIVDTLLDVAGILTDEDLQELINRTMGRFEYWEVHLLVGMTLAMGRVVRTPAGYLARVARIGPERFVVGQDRLFRDMKARWSRKYRELELPQHSEYLAVNI